MRLNQLVRANIINLLTLQCLVLSVRMKKQSYPFSLSFPWSSPSSCPSDDPNLDGPSVEIVPLDSINESIFRITSCDASPISVVWNYHPIKMTRNLISSIYLWRTEPCYFKSIMFWNYCIVAIAQPNHVTTNETILIQRISDLNTLGTQVSFSKTEDDMSTKALQHKNVSILAENKTGKNRNCSFHIYLQKQLDGNKAIRSKCHSKLFGRGNVSAFFPKPYYPMASAYFRDDIQEESCIEILNPNEPCNSCVDIPTGRATVLILHCSAGGKETSRQIVFPLRTILPDGHSYVVQHDIYTSWNEINPEEMMSIEFEHKDQFPTQKSSLNVRCTVSNYYFADGGTMWIDSRSRNDKHNFDSFRYNNQKPSGWSVNIEPLTVYDDRLAGVTIIDTVVRIPEWSNDLVISCTAPIWNSPDWITINRTVTVAKFVQIEKPRFANHEQYPKLDWHDLEAKFFSLNCKVTYGSKSNYTWTVYQQDLKYTIETKKDASFLTVEMTSDLQSMSGRQYDCKAQNGAGWDMARFILAVRESDQSHVFFVSVLSVSCVVGVIMLGMLFYLIRKRSELLKTLENQRTALHLRRERARVQRGPRNNIYVENTV